MENNNVFGLRALYALPPSNLLETFSARRIQAAEDLDAIDQSDEFKHLSNPPMVLVSA